MSQNSFSRYQRTVFWKTAGRTAAAVTAIGYALLEAALLLFDWVGPLRLWLMLLVLTVAICAAGYRGFVSRQELTGYRIEIDQTHSITTMVGDFIDNVESRPKAHFVFGANAEFSTSGLVASSVHAGFLKHFFPCEDEVATQGALDEAMKNLGLQITSEDGSSRHQHDLGTIVAQRVKDSKGNARVAYLFANSIRKNHGFSGKGSTTGVLESVWAFHVEHGSSSDELIFPLIGTGESKDFKKTKAITNIIDAYFAELENTPRSHEAPVRELVLSIHSSAVECGEINLEAVHRYMRARTAVFNS